MVDIHSCSQFCTLPACVQAREPAIERERQRVNALTRYFQAHEYASAAVTGEGFAEAMARANVARDELHALERLTKA
jgi:hypothetical protein